MKHFNYKSQIEEGEVVHSWHVSQSVDAFSASANQVPYDISISGSLKVTGSQFIKPTSIPTQTKDFLLSYDTTTGQIFKMGTGSIIDESDDVNTVYETGSSNLNIVPSKFADNFDNQGDRSTIAGGCSNQIGSNGDCSFVAAGKFNTASGCLGFIGAGEKNQIEDGEIGSGIIAGVCNKVDGDYSVIGAGVRNTSSGLRNFLGGGLSNQIDGIDSSVLGGGLFNCITSTRTFIGAGTRNTASGDDSVIVGGKDNFIYSDGDCSVIVGGCLNQVKGNNTFIGGGNNNSSSADNSFIGGGVNNTITSSVRTSQNYSFIGSAVSSCIDNGTKSVIIAGGSNIISSSGDFDVCNNIIGTGDNNYIISRFSNILTGNSNKISGSGLNGAIGSSIVNGSGNHITGSTYAFMGSGFKNRMSGSNHGAILVGTCNTASGARGIIIGGSNNRIDNSSGTGQNNLIGAGQNNGISGSLSSVIQGTCNQITGSSNFIGSGKENQIINNCQFIGGGQCNVIDAGNLSVIGGGSKNTSSAGCTVIGGGRNNEICTAGSFGGILGGDANEVNHACSFVIGSAIVTHAADTTHTNHLTVSGSGGSSVVILRNLPASSDGSGLATGQLYNDSGTLKIKT